MGWGGSSCAKEGGHYETGETRGAVYGDLYHRGSRAEIVKRG